MNTRFRLFAVALMGLLFATVAFAAAGSPSDAVALPDQVVSWLTPIIVPALLALVKKGLPKLPSWVIPLLAPVLGLIIGVIDNFAAGHSTNLWLAAGLGLLGVAVREVKEAVKPAPNGGWPVVPPNS